MFGLQRSGHPTAGLRSRSGRQESPVGSPLAWFATEIGALWRLLSLPSGSSLQTFSVPFGTFQRLCLSSSRLWAHIGPVWGCVGYRRRCAWCVWTILDNACVVGTLCAVVFLSLSVSHGALIELDAASYKAVSSSSKSGMFVYLNDMLIEGNAHRKRCWKWAPTRPTGALELCALVDRRVP